MTSRSPLRPRKTPTQSRSRATVEAILVASAQVFRRHGYAGATTDRIAERAGVSVGSVYQYFPNKDAILVVLAERHIDAGFSLVGELLIESVREAPPLAEVLQRFVRAMIALHEHEPELHRILFEEAPLPRPLRRQLRKRENEFAAAVSSLLEAHPEVVVDDPRVTGYVVVHMVDAVVHNFILHPPQDIDADELTEELVGMLLHHLTRDEAS